MPQKPFILVIVIVTIALAGASCRFREHPSSAMLTTLQEHYYLWHDSLTNQIAKLEAILPTDTAFIRIAHMLNDPHLSLSNTRSNTILAWPHSTPLETFQIDTANALRGNITYLHLVSFTSKDSVAFSMYAETNARHLSAKHTDTVVIDLRGNKGGHFWAFFASILPILPNGTYGSFRIGKESLPWRVRDNAVYQGSQLVYSLKQNVPKWKPKKIICLSDNYTGSSAEALLIALRSLGTKVQVYGKPTYGATSVTQEFQLPDDWTLKLPVGWFCNSAGQPITGRIYPDSTVGQTLRL